MSRGWRGNCCMAVDAILLPVTVWVFAQKRNCQTVKLSPQHGTATHPCSALATIGTSSRSPIERLMLFYPDFENSTTGKYRRKCMGRCRSLLKRCRAPTKRRVVRHILVVEVLVEDRVYQGRSTHGPRMQTWSMLTANAA